MDLVLSIIPMAHAAVDTAAFAKVMDPIVREIVYPIVYVLFTLGVFIFAYGVIEMIMKGSPEARETGRTHILFGVIGMFIMLSAWGIVHFVSDTLFDIRKGVTNTEVDNTIDPAGEIMK